jgi:hypothetical protein
MHELRKGEVNKGQVCLWSYMQGDAKPGFVFFGGEAYTMTSFPPTYIHVSVLSYDQHFDRFA